MKAVSEEEFQRLYDENEALREALARLAATCLPEELREGVCHAWHACSCGGEILMNLSTYQQRQPLLLPPLGLMWTAGRQHPLQNQRRMGREASGPQGWPQEGVNCRHLAVKVELRQDHHC